MPPTLPVCSFPPPDPASVRAARTALLDSLDAVALYELRFEVETATPITLAEHPGSALRGALVKALLDAHCTNKAAPSCAACPLVHVCPVSALAAPLREDAARGRDVPRPFVVSPPLPAPSHLAKGSPWSFGLTLFGPAAALFPYVVLAQRFLEANGLGMRDEAGRRGRFLVRRIVSLSHAGREDVLYERGMSHVTAPTRTPLRARVAARAESLPDDMLTLHLLSPLRLKAGGEILQRFDAAALVQRILERWEGLRREYGQGPGRDIVAPLHGPIPSEARGDPRMLLALGDAVRVAHDGTRWRDIDSYSSRQKRFTPIGGLLGSVILSGDLDGLREVLALGEIIRVGKDVVKGNGRYIVQDAPPTPSTAPEGRTSWS